MVIPRRNTKNGTTVGIKGSLNNKTASSTEEQRYTFEKNLNTILKVLIENN